MKIKEIYPWSRFPVLNSKRLVLRQLIAGDSKRLFSIFSEPESIRYWNSRAHTQEAQTQEFLEEAIQSEENGQAIRWGITLKECDDQLIGFGGFYAWNRKHFRGEIHYILDKKYWGQGFASEALKLILNYGFESMALNSIEAQVTFGNSDSNRLLKKLGFIQEGHLKENYRVEEEFVDSLIFSLMRKNWVNCEVLHK